MSSDGDDDMYGDSELWLIYNALQPIEKRSKYMRFNWGLHPYIVYPKDAPECSYTHWDKTIEEECSFALNIQDLTKAIS